MKKILILNGSPRRQGNISKMLEAMKQEAESCGAETVSIRVSDLKIHPCIGCMKCRDTLKCCLPEDDAQRVLQHIREADALIVGAPCYWGNVPGELKVLFDRMVYGMMGENSWGMPLPLHKGKKAMIISTCTTPYPFNILYNQTRGIVKALKEILKWSGFKIVKTIERGGTKKHPVLTDKEMTRARKAIHQLL
ncbi:MAG: flavodoxin family protein [Bacteroides sp.]|nr:flavodoxin family protein [Bacteroides sp.]